MVNCYIKTALVDNCKLKTENYFLICCFLFCVVIGVQVERGLQASDVPITIAQVHYGGGGDWYGDATTIKNWLQLLRSRTDIETANDRVIIKLTDHTLYQYPILYLVGHGNIRLAESEVEALRDYLKNGGFLFANDDYGLDKSFRREMRRVFSEAGTTTDPKHASDLSLFLRTERTP